MEPGLMNPYEFLRGWSGGLPETPCGYGSLKSQTVVQREILPAWVKQHNIKSVVDIGAGDLNWIKLVDWNVKYIPLDLVPRSAEVQRFDAIKEIPPKADMVMCLWVLNHLPIVDALKVVQNIVLSGSEWLAYTWWPAMDKRFDYEHEASVTIRQRIGAELRLVKAANMQYLHTR